VVPSGPDIQCLSAHVVASVRPNTQGVYVQHSIDIDGPIEAVSSAFAKGPRKWFPNLGGPGLTGDGFQTKVTVEVGGSSTAGSWTEVPITWRATYIKQLLPVMTGKVELAPVDDRVTRLNVCGMYQPPVGRLRKHFDDALMHKIAEATVKELAESIAKRLEALLAS
jgi:hypothetical protein